MSLVLQPLLPKEGGVASSDTDTNEQTNIPLVRWTVGSGDCSVRVGIRRLLRMLGSPTSSTGPFVRPDGLWYSVPCEEAFQVLDDFC